MDNIQALNIQDIPKELSVMLQMLSHQQHSLDEHKLEKIDWDLFVELALHHRLYPVLYPELKKVSNYVPANVLQLIHGYYKRNTFQMLHLSAEMEQVNELFIIKGIPLLFLKGPVLSHSLYGNLSLRTSSDLDFLIPIERLQESEQLLVELGYEKDDYIETVLEDWRWRHHHVTYFHPQKGIKLEIHWRLHPGPGKEPTFQELWNRKQTSKYSHHPIYMLGYEDLFIFLVLHGARHGWSRLRWLVDIHQILQKDIDWKVLHHLMKRYKAKPICGQAVILSSQFFQTNVPKELKPLINQPSTRLAQEAIFYLERMVNLHTDPVPEEVSNYHKRHLFSLMSNQQKILFILSFLYPYPEDAETLPLPKPLHFLYFPLRPFLWAWRKTRKHAIS
ncbi:nucleotidyltransferase domain-containing protein [Alkalihalobacterium chitinilyticum]|uniref:Nucleotidyltransferase family protein n=1 Tax=Alkalihalobacterium chitinilyticum TaxID=2980103 RepID=A0ABT5VEF0_9BACI|nr:nucleotidyltransferase family protein [Alkalihalobacterium chitinilyticum]MDE5413814.1 nucleotidyltransferase family protein [Alkalihalobacterium chitinilyticum]